MELFKIEHFRRQYPGKEFPSVRSLGTEEAEKIATAIRLKSGIHGEDSLSLMRQMHSRSSALEGFNAESEGFDLRSILGAAGITPGAQVYINWYRFDTIDCIFLKDLATYFDDIWYPGSDDIDLFDDTLSWIISVEHAGGIRVLMLNGS